MICERRNCATMTDSDCVGVEFVDSMTSKIVGTSRLTLSIEHRGSDLIFKPPRGSTATVTETNVNATCVAAVERTAEQCNGAGVVTLRQLSSVYQRSVNDKSVASHSAPVNGGYPPRGGIRIHGLSSASRRLRHRKNDAVPRSIVISRVQK